ncbi:MAG TPA: hypothetical protein VFC64_01910 [Atopostipes sp.]|nr:hypothetical protein [Atopostipes sp.]
MEMMEFLVMLIEQSDYSFIDGDGNHYKPDPYNVAANFISHLFEENFHEWVKEYNRVVEE